MPLGEKGGHKVVDCCNASGIFAYHPAVRTLKPPSGTTPRGGMEAQPLRCKRRAVMQHRTGAQETNVGRQGTHGALRNSATTIPARAVGCRPPPARAVNLRSNRKAQSAAPQCTPGRRACKTCAHGPRGLEKVPRGFEPRSLDSESRVLAVTP